ncbi:MAG TPA: DMT family transporter [Propionibacteriaceae bacterium]|nr:DMT family transporter [Propionibacteriaceae bacterium]
MPSTPETRRFSTGFVLGLFAMTLVGGSVAVSGALGDAPLFTAQAIRYAIAAGLLALIARMARVRVVRPRGAEWLWLTGIAATGLVLFNVAVIRGVAHAEPATIAVAVACVPVVIGLVGPLLDGQRPARRVILAAVVVTLGGVIVEGAGRTDAAGVAWAVVALLCEAAFTLLAVPVLRRQGAWGVSLHTVWIGTVMLVLLAMLAEGPQSALRLHSDDWVAIGYLALMVTAVAFLCWYSCVAIIGSGRAGLLTGVAPPAAAFAGAATIRQLPALPVWLGIGVVCIGLAIGLGFRRTRSSSETESPHTKRHKRLRPSSAVIVTDE